MFKSPILMVKSLLGPWLKPPSWGAPSSLVGVGGGGGSHQLHRAVAISAAHHV